MTKRFQAVETAIDGLLILRRTPIGDDRGYFERLFCGDDLAAFGHPGTMAQANRSYSARAGTVRGLHYQHPPHAEWKLVSCLRGRVLDVLVDIRRGSPTFLRHVAHELDGDSVDAMLVPPGIAHGFQTLVDGCQMLYFHSHPYVPGAEGGLLVDDPQLAIAWPLPFAERSDRDSTHPPLTSDYEGIAR